MSRKTTRTVTGFAVFTFAGFGTVLAAPAALADTGGEEFTYVCTADGDPVEGDSVITLELSAPPVAQTGEEFEVGLLAEGAPVFSFEGEAIAAGDATLQVDFVLGGDAAPSESASFPATNPEEIPPEQEEIEFEDAAITLTAFDPGELTFTPSDITTTATTASGTVTTECTTDDAPEIATTTVEGDAADPPDDDDDDDDGDNGDDYDDEDGGDDDGGDDDNGDAQQPPEDRGDAQAPPADGGGGLPVTGAALGGLVAAAVAALGGGGAAIWLSRRRKNASNAFWE